MKNHNVYTCLLKLLKLFTRICGEINFVKTNVFIYVFNKCFYIVFMYVCYTYDLIRRNDLMNV